MPPLAPDMDRYAVELINTGSELMLGYVLNTHQQWLCGRLAELGYPVARQIAVSDSSEAICDAVATALTRADVIIVTGGLGPTGDDLTRPLIAHLLGANLREDPAVVEHIERFFAMRNRPMPPSTRVQAMVPQGALVLPNAYGTAPGLVMEAGPRPGKALGPLLIMLPGPPRELHPMFIDQVAPLLRERRPLEMPFVCRTLKTTGLGESLIEERIGPILKGLTDRGLEIGYCARVGDVEIRLSALGNDATALVTDATELVRRTIGKYIYGAGSDTLESVVVRILTERKQTLALAESCTGGAVANRVTNVPGASAVFLCGFVTYSNEAKEQFLGVDRETLVRCGAVSEETAREMARGARDRTGADLAVAITGIAGPAGGTAEKPVGTVYLALASASEILVLRQLNPYDRETFKFVTAQQALDLLRRSLLKHG